MEDEEHEQLGYWNQFLKACEEDIYLKLSVCGMVVFGILCALIVVCWFRYEATISAMFDSKSGWSFVHHF